MGGIAPSSLAGEGQGETGDATSARKWNAAYAAWRPLRGGRWNQTFINKATARASMARHWPTGPMRSAVLAFTFT